MSLRERMIKETAPQGGAQFTRNAAAAEEQPVVNRQQVFQEMKSRLHRAIINRMDLKKLGQLEPEQLHAEVSRLAEVLLHVESTPLSTSERERLVEEVRHELFGLGPLEPLLADPTVCDILINSPSQIYVERGGRLTKSEVTFKDNEHLMRVIERIVSTVGRRIDESSPMVDARLKDGSRVNAIIPPLALDGPVMSIRRFGSDPLRIDALIDNGAITRDIAEMFRMCVHARLNVLISGGTAIHMLQAMNTGHDGSLTTIHANTPRDALSRVETMIQMTGMRLSEKAMRSQIASAIDLVIQVARLSDGTRRVTSISEITGMEGDVITMQEIFQFERRGVDKEGRVVGQFKATGVRPRFAERLKQYGMQLPRVFFEG